jgi:rhodanese-related sulfurtransferase
MPVSAIDQLAPQDLERRRKSGESIDLIDVRTPAEYRAVHAVGAENIPIDELTGSRLEQLVKRAADRPLAMICQGGGRSSKAAAALAAAGATHVANVTGGTSAWEAAGLPVERGRQTMALERQVRIAAGSLVVLGALLAWLVHPAFIGLSAFIGAGLVFSGVTNTCGMGSVLAKMPWNRN